MTIFSVAQRVNDLWNICFIYIRKPLIFFKQSSIFSREINNKRMESGLWLSFGTFYLFFNQLILVS